MSDACHDAIFVACARRTSHTRNEQEIAIYGRSALPSDSQTERRDCRLRTTTCRRRSGREIVPAQGLVNASSRRPRAQGDLLPQGLRACCGSWCRSRGRGERLLDLVEAMPGSAAGIRRGSRSRASHACGFGERAGKTIGNSRRLLRLVWPVRFWRTKAARSMKSVR